MQNELLTSLLTEYSRFLQAEKGMAETSRRTYLAAVSGFLAVCLAKPARLFLPDGWELTHLDKRTLEVYLNHLRDDRGWQASSLALQASALRGFFAYLQIQGRLERNPARSLKPRVEARTPAPPEGEEAAVLRLFERRPDTLKDARLLLLAQLFYGGGLRPIVVYRIQALNVNRRDGAVRLTLPEGRRQVALSPTGLAHARAYLAHRRSVIGPKARGPFWIDSRGRPCSPARLSREVRKALAGVELYGGPTLLRQLAAQHFRQRGGDTRSLRQLLGAKRLGELDRYAPPDYQEVLRQFRRLHPRQEGPV
jgi:site-specific recombinase XerC